MANAVMAEAGVVHPRFAHHTAALNKDQTYQLLVQATTAAYRKFADGSLVQATWPQALPAGVAAPQAAAPAGVVVNAAGGPQAAGAAGVVVDAQGNQVVANPIVQPPAAAANLQAALQALPQGGQAPQGVFATRLLQVLSTPAVRPMGAPGAADVLSIIASVQAMAANTTPTVEHDFYVQCVLPGDVQPTYELKFRIFTATRQSVSLRNRATRVEAGRTLNVDNLTEILRRLTAHVPPNTEFRARLTGSDIPAPQPSGSRSGTGNLVPGTLPPAGTATLAAIARALLLD